MTTYYRSRPFENLLDGYRELATETIYFAQPEELNAPMEGLSIFNWHCDEVVWGRLFEDFIRSAMYAVPLYMFVGETKPITWDLIPSAQFIADPNVPVLQKGARLSKAYLETPGIRRLVTYLAGRKNPVSEEELNLYLRLIHTVVVN